MNTEQKCCEKCIRWLSRPHPQAMGLFDCAFNFNCPCHTEQKGWREDIRDEIWKQVLESDLDTPFNIDAIISVIERTLQKQREEMVNQIIAELPEYDTLPSQTDEQKHFQFGANWALTHTRAMLKRKLHLIKDTPTLKAKE